MRAFKAVIVAFLTLLTANGVRAQMVADPTTWTYGAKKISDKNYKVVFHVKIKEGWHIFSLKPGGDGMQTAPSFTFDKNPSLKTTGPVTESGKAITGPIDGVEGNVTYFENKVDYTQPVTISANTIISGTYSYQVCNNSMCLPPTTVTFTIEIKDAGDVADKDSSQASAPATAGMDSNKTGDTTRNYGGQTDAARSKTAGAVPTDKSKPGAGDGKEAKSLLWLFLASLAGGIAAVLTPCVYSMIPITVSFFTKKSKTRKEGLRNALFYALSLIIIFTALGVLISLIFGSNALNTLSTNWLANLFFFVIFVIFGISFLGAFEITLPSSWINAADSKAGVGSFSGIFFMALTLAIVSFSCTGPIVGPLLVAAGKGGLLGPTVGMLGFSVGLSLPFALFAVFPGMLNKMASSGGWLNQVKVFLGFVELMLALKFFSNADLAMGWRLMDREVFVAIWFVLSVLIGLYLLGKLKLSHDDAPAKNMYGQEYVSIFKLFLAIAFFSFSVYLLPGMWGAPLNAISAFVPPMGTFDSFGGSGSAESKADIHPVKYVSDFKIYEPPVVIRYGLVTFYDYDEALAASKKLKKPLMLDFTGINCANCRKMESQVWSNPEVAKMMKEDFVVASLYVDMNRIKLPEEQQYFSKDINSKVVTVGNKNTDLQASKFGSNSQPFYFFVDENGNKLAEDGYPYDPDVKKFIAHLDTVIAHYKKTHS